MDSSSNDSDVKLLRHQNRQLSVRLLQKRKDIEHLEIQVQKQVQDNERRNATYLSIKRLWDKFNNDIIQLAREFTGKQQLVFSSNSDKKSTKITDPYIQRLLKGNDVEQKQLQESLDALDEDLVQAEKDLEISSSDTKGALRKIHEHMELLSSNSEEKMLQILKQNNPGVVEQVEAMLVRRSELQQQSRTAAAEVLQLKQQLKLKDDRLFEKQLQYQKLNNEFADVQVQLESYKAKSLEFQEFGSVQSGVAIPKQEAEEQDVKPVIKQENQPEQVIPQEQQDALEELRVELQTVKDILAERDQELQNEKLAHIKVQEELKSTRESFDAERWVVNTKSYKALEANLAVYQAEIEKFVQKIDIKQKEFEQVCIRENELREQVEVLDSKLRMSTTIQGQVQTLQQRAQDAETAKASLEAQLSNAQKDTSNDQDAIVQLSNIMQKNQEQLESVRATRKQQEASIKSVDVLKQQLVQAQGTAAKEGARATRLAAENQQYKLISGSAEENVTKLHDQVSDLQLFVNVLAHWSDADRSACSDTVDKQKLLKQVEELEGQLTNLQANGSVEANQEAQKANGVANGQKDTAKQEQLYSKIDALNEQIGQLQEKVKQLGDELQLKQQECDSYVCEIEVSSQAYDDAVRTISALQTKLKDSDVNYQKLLSEKLKIVQESSRLQSELTSASDSNRFLTAQMHDLKQSLAQAETRSSNHLNEVHSLTEQVKVLNAKADKEKRDETYQTVQSAANKEQVEALSAQLDQRKRQLEEETMSLQKEKVKRQKIDDEVKVLKAKVNTMRNKGVDSTELKLLTQEVDAYRRKLMCSICNHSHKSAVIVKCGHMFARECLSKLLDSRHRKCPSCGVMFAASDVRDIYFQ